ncbi:hypothetical protein ACWF95_37435 [Streptomyces vinaceus]
MTSGCQPPSALPAAAYENLPVGTLARRRPGLQPETAHRTQAVTVARRIAAGAHIIEHKAGTSAQAVQERAGVDGRTAVS